MKLSTKLTGFFALCLFLLGIVSAAVSSLSLQARGREHIEATRQMLMQEKKSMLSHHVETQVNTPGIGEEMDATDRITVKVEVNIGHINKNAGSMARNIGLVLDKAQALSTLAGQLKDLVGSYKV